MKSLRENAAVRKPSTTPVIERPLPEAVKAERALVALVACEEDWQFKDAAHVRPDQFYDPRTRAAWECLLALHARGVPLNLERLVDELGERGLIGEDRLIAESGEITSGLHHMATNETGATLAAQIVEAWERRELYRQGQALVTAAYDSSPAMHSTRARVERELGVVSPPRANGARPGRWQPEIQSARDLLHEQIAPARWAVQDLLPEGLTILAGKPKRGKSTLVLHLLSAIAQGGLVMGRLKATKGEVLYLALEDTKRRMQKRLMQQLDIDDAGRAPEGLDLAYKWLPIDRGGMEDLDAYADAHPALRAVAIDTGKKVKPRTRNPSAASTTLYDADYEGLEPLHEWANRRHLCLVVVMHTRKQCSDESVFDEISGSTAVQGVADNLLLLRERNGVTMLHRQGRDYEDDSPFVLRGDKESLLWTITGEDAVRARDTADQKALRAVLTAFYPVGRTPLELASDLGKSRAAVRHLLWRVREAGDSDIYKDGATYSIILPNTPNRANSPNRANRPNRAEETEIADEASSPVRAVRLVRSADLTENEAESPGHSPVELFPVRSVSPVRQSTQAGDAAETFMVRRLRQLEAQGLDGDEAVEQALRDKEAYEIWLAGTAPVRGSSGARDDALWQRATLSLWQRAARSRYRDVLLQDVTCQQPALQDDAAPRALVN